MPMMKNEKVRGMKSPYVRRKENRVRSKSKATQKGPSKTPKRKTEKNTKNMNAALERLFKEVPSTGPRERVDLAYIIIEDRE